MQNFTKLFIIGGILIILIIGGSFAWQKGWFSKIPFLPAGEVAQIGPDAVWSLPTEAIPELQKCHSLDLEENIYVYPSDCVVPIMEKYGASKKAIEFFEKTRYWFLTDFQEMGKVDLVGISTPWQANDNDQYALVNGSPSIVYMAEEAVKFSNQPQELINYSDMVNTFPKYSLWPGDNQFIAQEGESFLFAFDLKNEIGCHACGSGYMAVVSFDFNDGNYISSKLVGFCTASVYNSDKGIWEEVRDERFLKCGQFNETADWKTYRNEEYGFEFKVAPIFEEKGYRVTVEDKKALSEEYPGQTIDNLARITFETRPIAPHYASVSEKEYQGMFFIIIYSQDYCSSEGKEFCNKVRKGDALFLNYLAENENYFLYYNTGGTSGGDMWDAMGWNKDKVEQNFNQMLSTFEFVK